MWCMVAYKGGKMQQVKCNFFANASRAAADEEEKGKLWKWVVGVREIKARVKRQAKKYKRRTCCTPPRMKARNRRCWDGVVGSNGGSAARQRHCWHCWLAGGSGAGGNGRR